MAEKTALEKMRLTLGMSAALFHVPEELVAPLSLPGEVQSATSSAQADFVLDFATTQAQAEERLAALKPDIGPKTVAWLGYPKGSMAAGYDLNRDTVSAFAQTIDLVLVANISIDEKWSALRIRPPAR